MTRRHMSWLAAGLGVFGTVLVAQTPQPGNVETVVVTQAPPATPADTSDAALAFEVASVKPNNSAGRNVRLQIQPGGRFTATNVSLREIIRAAYQVQPFQIVGGPGWMNSDRFDIVAKAADASRRPARAIAVDAAVAVGRTIQPDRPHRVEGHADL